MLLPCLLKILEESECEREKARKLETCKKKNNKKMDLCNLSLCVKYNLPIVLCDSSRDWTSRDWEQL